MTWAYEKAQESQVEDKESGFRKVAVVAILKSLNQDEQRLDRLQKDAVASIASIFEGSEEPDVRASVIELYESMGKPSPYAKREIMGLKVGDALNGVPLVRTTHSDIKTPGGRHLHDWVVEMTDGRIVIIECSVGSLHLLRSLKNTIGMSWPDNGTAPKNLRGKEVSNVLLIHGGRDSDLHSQRPMDLDYGQNLSVLHWDPHFGDVDLAQKLKSYFTMIVE